ncbi:MAG: hypothetical protein ACREEP_04235, partial [Dongiaceae bacterium]
MKTVASQRGLLLFLSTTTLIGLYFAWGPEPGSLSVLGSLTAIVAAVTGFVVCARLAFDMRAGATHRFWQVVLALLGLVSISRFAGSFSGHIAVYAGLEHVGSYLVLTAALVVLCLSARFDPIPGVARSVLWFAFAIQATGIVADLLGNGPSIVGDPAPSSNWAYLFDLLSMELYLLGTA